MNADTQLLIDMGGRISKRRKEMHMTQEKLAEYADLSLQSISCIELGKKAVRPDNLVKLCEILHLSAITFCLENVPRNRYRGHFAS